MRSSVLTEEKRWTTDSLVTASQRYLVPSTAPGSKSNDGYFIIERLDDFEQPDQLWLPPWKRFAARLISFSPLLVELVSIWQVKAQFKAMLEFENVAALPSWMPEQPWLTERVAYTTAMLSYLAIAMSLLSNLKYCKALQSSWRARLRLVGDCGPSVDVVITVCGEAFEIVRDTVLATLNIDYPSSNFRVIVSDDGSSRDVALWIQSISVEHPNLYYTARSKPTTPDYKAGNLNHALEFVKHLPGGPAALVAGLDCDMIPERHWLRHVLPHIVQDPLMGVVTPAQRFYNTAPNDHLCQGQNQETRCVDVLRDLAGSGWNTGSGWVARRSAIEEIGGFPTESLTEDVHSSILMMCQGWKTAFLPEALQWGLMPETFFAHVKQFVRWYIGGCQSCLAMRFYLFKHNTLELDFFQRFHGFLISVKLFCAPALYTLSFVAIPVWIFSGLPVVFAASPEHFILLLRLQCIKSLLTWLNDVHLSLVCGYQATMRAKALLSWMSPYYLGALIRAYILPTSLKAGTLAFVPSGTIGNDLHERDEKKRANFSKRFQVVVFDHGLWPCLLLVLAMTSGITLRLYRLVSSNLGSNDMVYGFLGHIGSPPLFWFELLIACWEPLAYIIWPPTMPERRGLMTRESKSGLRYASNESKEGTWTFWAELRYPQLYTLSVVYSVAVLLLSFYM